MAIENVPINSGTGPRVAVDLVGTDNYQIVKIMQATDGATGGLAGPWAVTLADRLDATNDAVSCVQSGTWAITALTTGTINVVNVLSASGVTVASIATGTVSISGNIATVSNVLTVGTLLGTVAVSGGGGGVQYGNATTAQGATGTGTLVIGIQATTSRAMAIHTTGGLIVAEMPAVGGGVQYIHGETGIAATGTGTLVIGVSATTQTRLVLSASGELKVNTVGAITTGTVNVVNVLSASGVTIASVATGTMHVTNVLSATGVVVASLATGTVNVVNQVAVIGTAHASKWNAFAVNVTSGAHAILKTSGAHTLVVTDLMVSVDVPMSVFFYSSSAAQSPVAGGYFATKGGFALSLTTPITLTSAQSLVFLGGASGSCAAFAAGITVT